MMPDDMPDLPHYFHKRSIDDPMDSVEREKRFTSQSRYEDLVYDLPVVDYPPLPEPMPYVRTKRDTPLPPNHVIGKSPNVVHYTVSFIF